VSAEYESQIVETSTTALSADPAVVVPLLTVNSWILMQRKIPRSSVSLLQTWSAYRDGIGVPTGMDNYWSGLDKVYRLTQIGSLRLRIEVKQRLKYDTQHPHYHIFVQLSTCFCFFVCLFLVAVHCRMGQFFSRGAEPSLPENIFDSARKTAMLSCKITFPDSTHKIIRSISKKYRISGTLSR